MSDLKGSGKDQWKQLGEGIDDTLSQAAKWVQKRSRRSVSKPLITTDSGEIVLRWSGVASAVKGCAIAVSGAPAAGEAIALLQALYGVEGAQAAMLKSIDRHVRLLREGPFRSGQLLLHEAERIGAADEDYPGFLSRARDRLYDAHGLAASVQERALVEFHLGIVALLSGKNADAKHWLTRSHESGIAVVDGLASRSQNIKVLQSRKTAAALAFSVYGNLYVIPAKLKKIWSAELAANALREFIPFANCVAESLNAVSDDRPAATIAIREADDGTYEVWHDDPSD